LGGYVGKVTRINDGVVKVVVTETLSGWCKVGDEFVITHSNFTVLPKPVLPKKSKHKLLDLKRLQKDAHAIAVSKGFWKEAAKTPLESLMLAVSELAEAAEEIRNDTKPLYHGKTEGLAVEIADCILRLLDLAEHEKLPLVEALQVKNEYNRTREYLHGGKKK
jgi:NTP pyrophosphatase (non-canonical NTP hydrolase)